MRAAALRVDGAAVEDVLDVLLPAAPHGVHERPRDADVELLCLEPPSRELLLRAAGGALRGLTYLELPDDPGQRRRALHEPRIVAGRFHLRPSWAPRLGDALVDVVLDERAAFGTGAHPTTRMCLAALAGLADAADGAPGALADLGCGTGVLAIAAARLGFHPIVACDHDPASVAAAQAAVAENGVEVTVVAADLLAQAPPSGDVVVANVPAGVHAALAPRLAAPRRALLVSGVRDGEDDVWRPGYLALGLCETARASEGGWHCARLEPA